MANEFIWSEEKYQQQINPVLQYIEQSAKFLSIQRGIPVAEAEKFVKSVLRNKDLSNYKDPEIIFFERNDNWVREVKEGTLGGYLKSAIQNKEVIVPTLTTYVNPEEEKSLISEFMKRNAGRRAVLKHKSQEEEARGNLELAYQLNNDQDNAKRNNNSMSGVMAALGSIFENPTGHNTLTSMTRSMSSISNALNERMISGNRHYMDSDTVINNMTVIVTTMDDALVEAAIKEYNLVIPSAQDIADIVSKSANKYWRDRRHVQKVYDYAAKMTGLQRAAFAYTQDLYHIRQLNPDFVRNLINDFAKWRSDLIIPEPVKYIKSIDPLIANYAHQIFISDLKGQDKDRSVWAPELQLKVAQGCMTVSLAIQKYKKLIDAFLVVKTVPNSSAFINHMSRESVVLSDTDSTMFSVDEWVLWYFGKLEFHDFAFAVAGSIMFISTQLIAHALAILSANMNVARERLFLLSMKPEFVFPVFAQTPVAKHYFCSMSVKEGAVYPKAKYEIKGVHLKNSSSPAEIVHSAQAVMTEILDTVYAGKKVDIYAKISRIAKIEREIRESIMKGEPTYLKRVYVKASESYTKGPEESPYRFHTLWNTVFGPSYSEVDAPPYAILKLPMITTSKKKMAEWINSFEDTKLADRYRKYLTDRNRTDIKTMYISQDFVQAYGIPKEIQAAIDIKKVILDLTLIDRMVMQTLGVPPKLDTLFSDQGY